MRLSVFDENLIAASTAGNCLLKMVQGVKADWPVHVFVNQSELGDNDAAIEKTYIPVPARPVALRTIVFTVLSSLAYLFSKRTQDGVTIGTEGVFPFCDICYAHFCHRAYLDEHREQGRGSFRQRMERLLVQHWGAWTERVALGSARIVVTPSRGLAEELKTTYPKLVAGKLRVIANPVDLASFSKPGEVASADGALRLCFCAAGNFERRGLSVVMEALQGLRNAPVRLMVVGGSPDEISQFQMMANALGVSHQIRFDGMQEDIRPYLWGSDVFLFPSAYEVFPLICLQAAAAGLALMTTGVYGVEEFMEAGATGWIVRRDAASIATAITEAIGNRGHVQQMGKEARRRVEEYGQERFVEKWKLLLSETC